MSSAVSQTLIEAVYRALRTDPERIAVIDGRTRVTAGSLAERIETLAARLSAIGVSDTSTVAFAARGVGALVGLLAIRQCGARAAILDPQAGSELLTSRIKAAGADIVLADAAVHLAAGVLAPLARRRGIQLPRLHDLAATADVRRHAGHPHRGGLHRRAWIALAMRRQHADVHQCI